MYSYFKLPTRDQLKIDVKGYILIVVLNFLPAIGWDLGLNGRFLTAAVYLTPFYIAYQIIKIVKSR